MALREHHRRAVLDRPDLQNGRIGVRAQDRADHHLRRAVAVKVREKYADVRAGIALVVVPRELAHAVFKIPALRPLLGKRRGVAVQLRGIERFPLFGHVHDAGRFLRRGFFRRLRRGRLGRRGRLRGGGRFRRRCGHCFGGLRAAGRQKQTCRQHENTKPFHLIIHCITSCGPVFGARRISDVLCVRMVHTEWINLVPAAPPTPRRARPRRSCRRAAPRSPAGRAARRRPEIPPQWLW